MKKILILCTGNSCRSQILEAWLRHFSEGKFEVYSAGVETHGINPDAVFYMNEIGIDLSSHTSDLMDKYLHMEFDLIVTVCDHAKETCPVFPKATQTIHRNFEDPSKVFDEKEAAFRRVRAQLEEFAKSLVEKFV
jgi:arsenate reductase